MNSYERELKASMTLRQKETYIHTRMDILDRYHRVINRTADRHMDGGRIQAAFEVMERGRIGIRSAV